VLPLAILEVVLLSQVLGVWGGEFVVTENFCIAPSRFWQVEASTSWGRWSTFGIVCGTQCSLFLSGSA